MINFYRLKRYDGERIKDIADLNNKVNYYVSWCEKNGKGDASQIRNIIEKVAVWYEMRYPNASIGPNNAFGENYGQDYWIQLMDYDHFYALLTSEEKQLLKKPIFPSIVNLSDESSQHFHLAKDGMITDADDIYVISHNVTDGKSLFEGHHIREVERIVNENNLARFELENVRKVVSSMDDKLSVFNGLLDAIICHIIHRGGDYYGPKRGMLFAKEFDRSLDLGMQYGANHYDLICHYLENGGSRDLKCYPNYFENKKSNSSVSTMILSQLLSEDEKTREIDKNKVYKK